MFFCVYNKILRTRFLIEHLFWRTSANGCLCLYEFSVYLKRFSCIQKQFRSSHLAHVFSCEFCEISKNTWATASGSCSQMFFKIGVLKNFTNFVGNHWSFFLNKVAGLKLCNFIKRDSNTGVFLWICEILGTRFFKRTPLVAASVYLKRTRLKPWNLIRFYRKSWNLFYHYQFNCGTFKPADNI